MSDELTNYLMNGERHASLSAESLELMGKQAANRLLNDGIPLNETIVKLAGEHQDINGEQVRRVVEFANNAVYLAMHDSNKTAGANSSYPQFEIADPARILQDLSDGARPTVTTKVDVEYSKLPEKKADVELRDDVIERVFGFNPDKLASDSSATSPINQVVDAKGSLNSLRENLEHHGEQFTMALKQAQDEYYDLTKNYLLEGGSFADVIVAARSSGADKSKIAYVFQPIIARLLKEKVASPVRLQLMTEQLEKVAHRVVNEKHPLVSTFKSIVALESEIDKIATSLSDIDTQLDKVNNFIKEQFLARSTG